jgi:conjugative relaxase-like TrwC/TraI family protein
MLSSKSIGSGGGAAEYYEGLASEDYYTEGGEPPGKWVGEYAREIGLVGEVQKGELAAGFAGFHPRTGEQIANNAGADHKAGYDLTFSAPKSVSTTWATADRETQQAISAAQQRAVEKALDYASKNAFHQREGHAGSIKVEHTSGIAAATFEHATSREGDPQLHTHALVLNLAENGKRIDFDTSWKHATGAAYRAELANEMQALGYKVERDGSSFKIEGVPDSLEREFSTRRQQIEAAMREHGTAGGKAAQAAALATREAKGEVNRAELFERAREVAKEHGFDPESIRAHEFVSGERRAVEPDKFDSVTFLDAATAQASTLTRPQLEKELFQAAQGSMTIEQAQAKLEDLKQRGELVELRDNQGGPNRWTTREMLAIEQRIASNAGRAALEKSHPVSQASLDSAIAKKSLSDDQKQALRHITSPERIALVQGVAGAGKSYMLDAARDAWQSDGYTVLGAALAGKAAEGLQESSGIESGTIHSLVGRLDLEQVKLDSRTILVVDEAGMVGSRLYDRLQQHADAAGAKLVLVGDTQQLQPIDAGGAMRAVQERAGAVVMDEIRRQVDPEQRQIVRDFKDGRADAAIDRLEKLNQVKIYETTGDARNGMASTIVKDITEGKTSIGLAGTRAEVHQINELAKAEAQQAGLVSQESYKFQTERGGREFSDGDRVIFLKNDNELGVKNGTTGTVERAAEGNLKVTLDNGKSVELGDQKYRDIDHGYAMTVHKSQGVTVDRAHMMPGKMTDQHSAYVGASRHRETVQIHGTAEQVKEMRQTAGRDHTKDTSADQRYTPIERPDDRPPAIEEARARLEEMKQAFSERVAELRERFGPEQAQPAKTEPDQVKPDPDRAQPDRVKPEAESPKQEPAPAKPEVEQAKPAKEADQVKPDPMQVKEVQTQQAQATKDAEQPAKDAAAKPGPDQVKPDLDHAQPDQVKPEAESPKQESAPAKPEVEQAKPAKEADQPKPTPKQIEQQRQLKAEAERHRQRKPERQAQQQRQLKAEAERHRRPERQAEQPKPVPKQPDPGRGR